jgi:hypothetical protein
MKNAPAAGERIANDDSSGLVGFRRWRTLHETP